MPDIDIVVTAQEGHHYIQSKTVPAACPACAFRDGHKSSGTPDDFCDGHKQMHDAIFANA